MPPATTRQAGLFAKDLSRHFVQIYTLGDGLVMRAVRGGDHVSRVQVGADTDGDGRADERTEVASDLVLPRGVLPFEGGAVCILPPEIVFLRDDDGDGAFDVREVIDTGVRAALDNPEHDVNAPTLGRDNWIHVANWKKSYRRVVGVDGEPGWITRREAAGGQWGLSVDEVGRLYRNTNPNPLHVDVLPPHHARRNGHQRRFRGTFERSGAQYDTYPARINPGVNRGYQPSTLRDDFTLARFTGACSPLVHTGAEAGCGFVTSAAGTAGTLAIYMVTGTMGPAAIAAGRGASMGSRYVYRKVVGETLPEESGSDHATYTSSDEAPMEHIGPEEDGPEAKSRKALEVAETEWVGSFVRFFLPPDAKMTYPGGDSNSTGRYP